MKTIIFMPEATIEEREKALKKACVLKSEETYNRTLTESEIEREKTNYVENGIRLKEVELEAKTSADAFKAKKSVIEKAMDEQLDRVQNRSRKVLDVLYGIPDNENSVMRFYDKYGEAISSRPLTPDEFNGRLFNNEGESFNDGATVGTTPAIGYEVKDADFEEAEVIGTAAVEDPESKLTDDDLPDFLKPDKAADLEKDNEQKPEEDEKPQILKTNKPQLICGCSSPFFSNKLKKLVSYILEFVFVVFKVID